MREALIPYIGRRLTVRAVVARRGHTISPFGVAEPTLLLEAVTTPDGAVITDHCWLVVRKRLAAARPVVGDALEFTATIKPYRKYKTRRPGQPARYREDLKLAFPMHVRRIGTEGSTDHAGSD